jgi:hypothetical protein
MIDGGMRIFDRRVVCCIVANQRCWQPNTHNTMPPCTRQVVHTMMLIRIVEHQPKSILLLLPNELMFEIFSHLPIYSIARTC